MRMKNGSNLEELCLEDTDFQGISSQIIAEALNKLERFTILENVTRTIGHFIQNYEL